MKYRIAAGFALALLLSTVPALAAGQPAIDLTVTGQGNATQMPDMATVNFGVTTTEEAADVATSQNNAIYEKVLASIVRLGVARSDVRTTYYNLSYNPRPQPTAGTIEPRPPLEQRYGYTVSRGIIVTLHDTKLVGKAIDTAVAAGVTNVDGVAFGAANNRKLYAQALNKAVSDARAQADAMASAAGLHILRIKAMQQGYAPVPMMRMATTMAVQAPNVPTNIEPNSVEVNATVTITYVAQ
ncbi:MAG: SIMPL domain-containing protein [Vulcanimicrobiaceae bacterium]